MPTLYKKVLSFKNVTTNLTFKGLLKIVCLNKLVELNVVVTSIDFKIKNLTAVFYDGVNTVVNEFSNLKNAYFKIENFNAEKLTCVILNGNDVIAVTPEIALSTVNDILKTATNLKKEYDDEALSSYNYYDENGIIFNENFNAETPNGNEEIETLIEEKPNLNETNSCKIESDKIFSTTGNILEFLKKYPENKELSNLLPNAKFATVNYDGEKRYFVGVSTFDGVSYASIAVKGYFGGKGLENSFFIPISVVDLQGEGYFVSFKNLTTGETVKNLLQ